MQKKTIRQEAAIWNISTHQVRQQYADNAKGLRSMHAKSVATGKKVNGYTAEELDEMASRYEAMSKAKDDQFILAKGETYENETIR